ncbi:MAG: HD domain-containing protein, partial [Pseudomonadota bacterium]
MAYDTGLRIPATSSMTATASTMSAELYADDQSALAQLREHCDDSALIALSEETFSCVNDLGLDPKLKMTAALAPFVRAGQLKNEQVAKQFGRDVALLCRELETLFELSLPGQWTPGDQLPAAQGEALRRMLLAVVNDYRLVVIRLAVQLADLRAARKSTAEDQRMLARDTREIFAPLANRLGIWQLKWELEDYAFRYLDPEAYRRIAAELDERRDERLAYIEDVKTEISALLAEAGMTAEVTGRPKHIY